MSSEKKSGKAGKAEKKHAERGEARVERSEVLLSIKGKESEAAKRLDEEQKALEKSIGDARKSAAEMVENARKAAEAALDRAESRANLEAAAKGKAVLAAAKRDATKVKRVSKEDALTIFSNVVRRKFGIGANDA